MNQIAFERLCAIHKPSAAVRRALKHCRGRWQVAVILQGATLRTLTGRARSYGGHYQRSIMALADRLRAAGVAFEWRYGPRDGWLGGIQVLEG
jgi:hypothetical protein